MDNNIQKVVIYRAITQGFSIACSYCSKNVIIKTSQTKGIQDQQQKENLKIKALVKQGNNTVRNKMILTSFRNNLCCGKNVSIGNVETCALAMLPQRCCLV